MTASHRGYREPSNRIPQTSLVIAMVFVLFNGMWPAVSVSQQVYPVDMIVSWTNPTVNMDGTPLTNLIGIRLVCERDGIEFVDDFIELPVEQRTIVINQAGLVLCWAYGVNAERGQGLPPDVPSNKRYGVQTIPGKIVGMTAT